MASELKIEIEQGPAWLLVRRVSLQRLANETWNRDIPEVSESFRKEDARLGRLVRKQLRAMGFERDCEIDSEMEALAIETDKAFQKLASYIGMNSPKSAELLTRHGDDWLKDWQSKRDTPIRPSNT